ncbi:MAG: hypothetical protein HON98_04785 [Chloroflexi bacterium]|jgi:hypothetical protein|nr:hypothetical protein [Chloroflexota bacterium]MBT3671145.1 hypothetical protein [Chloroflexota bacterium]MBT4004266.1 hypothetical protein [Chloroflexota bacterium]MBT4304396.1 hypothetical protein [Chloroflexota bacterium]MBT4534415.1 hypothetical protein [Chloroflexota bacterium]
MNENNFEKEPEIPPVEAVEIPVPVEEPVVIEDEPKKEKLPPTKFQKNLRKALIWAVGILAIFLAGVITNQVMRYKPFEATVAENEILVQEAHEEEIIELQHEIGGLTSHRNFLNVLVDVNNARIALFLKDIDGAKIDLLNTQESLSDIHADIARYDSTLAESMSKRLSLIISGLERDSETAIIDLDLLTKDLLEIESVLFDD